MEKTSNSKLNIKTIALISCFLLPAAFAGASDFEVFGPYRLGENKSVFQKNLGKPDKTESRGDLTVNIYFSKDEQTYFLYGFDNKGIVRRIQATGSHPYADENLDGLALGNPEDKMAKILGSPTQSTYQDEKWGTAHQFGQRNVTVETKDGKVNSIYIIWSRELGLKEMVKTEIAKPAYKSLDKKVDYILNAAYEVKNNIKFDGDEITDENYTIAAELFDMALQLDPKNLAALVNQGNCYKELKQYDRAKARYLEAEKIDSSNLILTYNLGLINYNLKNYNEAKKYLQRVVDQLSKATGEDKNDEVLIDAYTNLGNVYDDTGDSARAIKSYQSALAIDKESEFASLNLAILYKNQGLTKESKTILQGFIKKNPKNRDAEDLLKELNSAKSNPNKNEPLTPTAHHDL